MTFKLNILILRFTVNEKEIYSNPLEYRNKIVGNCIK